MLKGIEFLNQWAGLRILLHSRVQPVLFHINISQRDQAPALCALPQGARIPHKLTLIQSPGNGCLPACKPEGVWGYTVCVCVCVCMTPGGTQHHWCGHRAKVHSEMCGLGSRGAMASVNGEGRVSTSTLTLSSFSRLLCHLHFSAWHAWRPPPLSQVTRGSMEVKKERTTEQASGVLKNRIRRRRLWRVRCVDVLILSRRTSVQKGPLDRWKRFPIDFYVGAKHGWWSGVNTWFHICNDWSLHLEWSAGGV